MVQSYEGDVGSAPNSLGRLLRELAVPYPPGDKVKAAIARAAEAAGFDYWRTFDLWYGKARRIEPHEIKAIQHAIEDQRQRAARNELHDLRVRLAKLEASLAAKDEAFFSPQIDAFSQVATGLGRLAPKGVTS